MTEAHPQRCDHWDICYFRCGQIGRCIENDKQGCQFALHSSAKKSSDVLDKAKAKLDGYYKSLPAKHPYLDGIDLSIQKIEELQEELRTEARGAAMTIQKIEELQEELRTEARGAAMTIQGFWQSFKCSIMGKRCLFCDEEVCAFHPSGNPFIGTEYRKAMEKVRP